jgi:F-type H+-transporting ATPase subunit epsilon
MKLQYFENDSDEGLVSFDVEPQASKTMSDIEEPLRGRRADGTGKKEDTRYKEEVKQKYVGRIDADKAHGNMNINHYFAAIQNKMNYAQSTKMKLEIITPEASIFSGEVTSVTLPGLDGMFQVLNNHAPIISSLRAGEVKMEVEGKLDTTKLNENVNVDKNNTLRVTIKGGVAELMNNKLILLAE